MCSFSLLLILIVCGAAFAQITLYYENLIRDKVAKALTYQLPENNEEFREGVNSEPTYNFGTFDFIIVGSGSSGSVLATRLSEIEDFSILLLEAGGEEDDFSNIPRMHMYLQYSDMNWGYYSTPQRNCCLAMREQKCAIPRGKLIGGTSSINNLMYVRGNPKDFDKWSVLGNPGWSYEDVLPYFIKSENSQIDGDPGYHGKGGQWELEYALPDSPFTQNFADGTLEMNMPILDYNGRYEYGSSRPQFNIKRGKRQSTGTAFLDNARKRDNLIVKTKALVTRIIIDAESKIAEGVEFVSRDQKFVAIARKEVIVSGGAINSPQLLMLSGIGPRDHLEELEIEVVVDLPVGKNLLEHPFFGGLVFRTNYTLPTFDLKRAIREYLQGFGPFTNGGGQDWIGFIKTEKAEDVPTIEFVLVSSLGISAPIFSRVHNYNDEIKDSFLNQIDPSNSIMVYLILLHEKSRGRITLKSKDPIDFPNIDVNMLSEQEDVDTLIEGIEFIADLAETDAFKAIGAELLRIPICGKFKEYSRGYWECVLHQMTSTLFHPSGTTAMGQDAENSVVDSNLKVHGVQGLRVVDVGVFPTTLSGHPNAAAVMVAEKISDVIKSDYGYKEFFK